MNNRQRMKRIAMSVIGVSVCGISVGMFKHASLGIDPFQTLMSGLNAIIPIRFGTLYVIVNAVLLSVALVFDRRKIGIATLINLFLLGYIAEGSQWICSKVFPGIPLIGRIVLLLAAIILLSLSSSLYFTADLGVSTYDAISLIISQRQDKVPFQYCRMISDLCCVILGVTLCLMAGFSRDAIFGIVNIGTIITAFFMGPLIQWFNEHVAKKILN